MATTPTNNLYCVLYHSTAVTSFSSHGDLTSLADFAKHANKAVEISGALFYSNGFFVQYLEGEMQAVQKLVARIGTDNRHRDMTILAQHAIAHRYYGEWSMESFDLRESEEASALRLSSLFAAAKVAAPDGKLSAEKIAANLAYALLAVFVTPPQKAPRISA